MSGIGLLNETLLHASLKRWYARPGDRFEVAVDGFVIDIVRDDLLIEIQTGHFAAVKSKLAKLTRSRRVRLIHPIALDKWIVRSAIDGRGGVTRRKSPIREEEVRRYVGKWSWRRRGWAVEERRLLEVLDRRRFDTAADWLAVIPARLASFTAKDLAAAIDTGGVLAQKMAYCLREGGVIETVGRRGRANLYRVAADRQRGKRQARGASEG